MTTPIFKDRSFEVMFRLSRSRVQRICDDIVHANHPFYMSNVDATGKNGASLEAKVLFPLKAFAYRVAPHVFLDYFQMSKPLAGNVVTDFLRSRTNFIVKNICVSLMIVTSRTS